MACFGVSKADTEIHLTKLPESLPGMISGPRIQYQPSGPPVMDLDHIRVPVQENDTYQSSGALDTPSHQGSVIPKGKVTEVLSIHYAGYCLKGSMLLVVVRYEGKETKGQFNYDDIHEHDGVQEALKVFRPMWETV